MSQVRSHIQEEIKSHFEQVLGKMIVEIEILKLERGKIHSELQAQQQTIGQMQKVIDEQVLLIQKMSQPVSPPGDPKGASNITEQQTSDSLQTQDRKSATDDGHSTRVQSPRDSRTPAPSGSDEKPQKSTIKNHAHNSGKRAALRPETITHLNKAKLKARHKKTKSGFPLSAKSIFLNRRSLAKSIKKTKRDTRSKRLKTPKRKSRITQLLGALRSNKRIAKPQPRPGKKPLPAAAKDEDPEPASEARLLRTYQDLRDKQSLEFANIQTAYLSVRGFRSSQHSKVDHERQTQRSWIYSGFKSKQQRSASGKKASFSIEKKALPTPKSIRYMDFSFKHNKFSRIKSRLTNSIC